MSGAPEVLEAGRPPRSPARVAAILALLLVLGLLVAGLDRSSRARESEQVAACRRHGTTQIAAEFDRLTARTGLVRPTVFALSDGHRKRQLLGLISEAVAGADERLRSVGARCEEVTILWHHGDLARRRDDCAGALEELATWFREVSRDGAHALGGSVNGGGACR